MSIVGAGPGASLRAPASAAGDVLADAAFKENDNRKKS